MAFQFFTGVGGYVAHNKPSSLILLSLAAHPVRQSTGCRKPRRFIAMHIEYFKSGHWEEKMTHKEARKGCVCDLWVHIWPLKLKMLIASGVQMRYRIKYTGTHIPTIIFSPALQLCAISFEENTSYIFTSESFSLGSSTFERKSLAVFFRSSSGWYSSYL